VNAAVAASATAERTNNLMIPLLQVDFARRNADYTLGYIPVNRTTVERGRNHGPFPSCCARPPARSAQ